MTPAPRCAFALYAIHGAARTVPSALRRDEIRPQAFMPVGTAATVTATKPADVRATGADILLGNSCPLSARPLPATAVPARIR